jgi:methylated-DNA-[protein]-cysteine S-methyltransferase
MNTYSTTIDSPVGPLLLRCTESAELTHLQFAAQVDGEPAGPLAATIEQLREYFAGERSAFTIPLAPGGNAFELRVWEALREIPYGETVSYGEIARRIGSPTAARAVGLANGRNPIAVIVPCHRVIGADGSLTGYGGGLERKRLLLDLEAGRLALT